VLAVSRDLDQPLRLRRAVFQSRNEVSERSIQPVGIYANNGFWYCVAYCFLRRGFRLFRRDRMWTAELDATGIEPLDHRHIHLGNWRSFDKEAASEIRMTVELSREGAMRCEAELWPVPSIEAREDGGGRLDQIVPASEIPFFAKYFLGLGNEATVTGPPELVNRMRELLAELTAKYGQV